MGYLQKNIKEISKQQWLPLEKETEKLGEGMERNITFH